MLSKWHIKLRRGLMIDENGLLVNAIEESEPGSPPFLSKDNNILEKKGKFTLYPLSCPLAKSKDKKYFIFLLLPFIYN